MTKDEILEILNDVGALVTDGHFAYTSGRHGNAFVNKDAIYPHTEQVELLCEAMADPYVGENIDAVAGPTIGGVILTQWVAHKLSKKEHREVVACFAEEHKDEDGSRQRYFGRGYEKFIQGKRILLVEDILTTGGSIKRVVEAVRAAGGTPIAVQALCNRGGVTPDVIGVERLSALCDISLQSWEPDNCPLCRDGVPISILLGKGSRST
jgi:orotate phosphoribosyltransferase